MKFVSMLLYVGAALVICQVEGVTEFPCMFPNDWIDKVFTIYRGSPPIPASYWSIEADGRTLFNDGDPYYCHQITDQFYVIGTVGENKFECITIDFTPGENNFTIGDRGIPKVVDPLPPGAFNETVLCSLCSEATSRFVLAVERPIPTTFEEPKEIKPIKCDVPYFCTSGTGTICEAPMITTKTPMTTRKKSCASRRKHA